MTIANDIISCRIPDFDRYLQAGESLDDIDEYGFTPLIETAITRQLPIAKMLIERGVDVNKPDVGGRTALHWAVDNNDLPLARFLLQSRANANAYTRAGLSVLVYPVLRGNDAMKQLLYEYGARLDFSLDFIYGKLLGHRFELQGDVDIVNAQGEFIELDYEGFMLEFTVAVVKDSLRRFTSSYATRAFRYHFPELYPVIDALEVASELLKLQQHVVFSQMQEQQLAHLIQAPMLILPAASRGHALCFIRYGKWWAKIDRGENSLKEGSINLYKIGRPDALTLGFIKDFLYKKQSRAYFHQQVNRILDLKPVAKIPMSSQISGNCSWANVQAVIPTAQIMQHLMEGEEPLYEEAIELYHAWVQWDQDRALDECVQRFYLASPTRKASLVAMLAGVLFQACHADNPHHLQRAEKILTILNLDEYRYVLQSYLEAYCVQRLTPKGNNLLKILDDCGINPNVGVSPVATPLPPRNSRG